MKPLAETFKYDGFDFTQVTREGNLAIYRQSKDATEHFEVVIIEIMPDREIMGKFIPSHEKYPAAEQWGTKGWTYQDLDSARNKFRALTEGEDD